MDNFHREKKSKENRIHPGVYQIQVSGSKFVFLGYSIDPQARIDRHRAELELGDHSNRDLQKAWKEHGEESIAFTILDRLENLEESAYVLEQELEDLYDYWLDELREAGSRVIELDS